MAGILAFQVTLTGTALQFPSNPNLNQGNILTISNPTGNAAVTISSSSANNSTGFILPAGTVVSIGGLKDTADIWVNGTSTQKVSAITAI